MSWKIESGPRSFRVPKTAELVANQLRNKIIRNELPDGHPLASENDLLAGIFDLATDTARSHAHPGIRRPGYGVSWDPRRTTRAQARPAPRRAAFRPHPAEPRHDAERHFHSTAADRADLCAAARGTWRQGGSEKAARTARKCRKNIDDDAAFSATSTRFHNTIIELSGNAPLILLMGTLNHIFELHISASTISSTLTQTAATSRKADLETQARLVECIEARDGDAAETVAREFLARVDRQLRKLHDVDQVIDVLR